MLRVYADELGGLGDELGLGERGRRRLGSRRRLGAAADEEHEREEGDDRRGEYQNG